MKEDRGQKNCPEHDNASDINRKLIINFRDISHTMRTLYEGRGSQKRVLIVLLETGKITQRALTERLGIQPGSASEVIAKLESAGLLVRTAGEEDRRTADISLTEAGVRQAEEAKIKREQRHEQMFACLSDCEKTQLLALLEKLSRDWETRYRAPDGKERVSEGPSDKCAHHSDGKRHKQE